jgi:CRISPR system Cascade subunit CasC
MLFLELHTLQNFAPSCLNRDETNSPKTCQFGGVSRARLSSQTKKRRTRKIFEGEKMFPPELLATRTRGLRDLLVDRFCTAGKDLDMSIKVAEVAIKSWQLGVKENGLTDTIPLITSGEVDELASVCLDHWEALCQAVQTPTPPQDEEPKTKKEKKKAAKGAVPPEVSIAFNAALTAGGKAVDVALFGRMLANKPGPSRTAACQVAHAITTHQVGTEFDFFTAIDDLDSGVGGAAHAGNTEFNSGCFYSYANIDLGQLEKNLHFDKELSLKSVEAFILAFVAAIPTGKQNSMAAQNPPSMVFAVVRDGRLWSLSNAFVDPVRPGANGGIIKSSISALENYWEKLAAVYGEDGIKCKAAVVVDGELNKLKDCQVASLRELVAKVMGALNGESQ